MADGRKVVIYAALAGNLLIAVTKFVAAAYTGSAAMTSEGVHSLVDTGNGALLLYGMHRAKQPPDRRFPFGHGKEIYFWSFVVALLIFSLGAGVAIYEGVQHLRVPVELERPVINYVVLGLCFLFEGGSWLVAWREFAAARAGRGFIEAVEGAKDPTTFAVLLEDSAALLGLFIALAGLVLGQVLDWPILDGVASALIGLVLAATAVLLARETKGLLIGESASPEVVEGIRALIQRIPEVDQVNEILTMHIGPDFVLANISVMVRPSTGRARVHELFEQIDAGVKARHPVVKRVFIESEAAPHADPRPPG